ncbi:MAG: ABC transporter ATP-binding protein [Clostridia bacterium]|nr:ABC transporter ATP-binding protein [Clostridia bacterium]
MTMNNEYAIEMKHITKRFGEVVANRDINLNLRKGEILSLLGENGSGKTTLMNMISGIYYPDEGEIYVNGELVKITSPKDARDLRIGMVHQHFKLIDVFTACDNIILGDEPPKINRKQVYMRLREKYSASMKEALANKDYETRKAINKQAFREGIKTIINRRIQRDKVRFLSKKRSVRINSIAQSYGFNIDFSRKIYDMSVSEKQTVEIFKTLYKGAEILILDEPTAVLTPQEISKLFDILRKMKEDGKSIIIITHKLNEVMEISDRIAILRKGEHVGTVNKDETNEKELANLMVGEKIELNINRKMPVNAKPRLYITDLTIKNKDGTNAISNATFTINGGEILGIAGISGNGQKELLEGIAGLQKKESGEIIFHNPKENKPVTLFHKTVKQVREMAEQGFFHDPEGNKITTLKDKSNKEVEKLINDEQIIFYEDEIINLNDRTPREIQQLGIKLSFVPEDRLSMGLVGNMSIVDNMLLRSYRKGNSIFVNRKKPKALADKIIEDLNVVTPSDMTQVRKLSGGNVQKVLVGREISSSPKVLMTAYPVRGLDINSSYLIYNLLNEQKEKGVAVLYVGEDLDVLLQLCDRIVVLCGGKISGIVDARNITKEEVGLLMTKKDNTTEIGNN